MGWWHKKSSTGHCGSKSAITLLHIISSNADFQFFNQRTQQEIFINNVFIEDLVI